MPDSQPSNEEIVTLLERIADLLEDRGENPFRVRAYRNGAATVRRFGEPLVRLLREGGEEALRELPGIGEGLAGAIAEYVQTGRSGLLDRLQAESSPVEAFARVPGIGRTLATRIVERLGIHTLAELEQATYDGSLARVQGFGDKRVEAVRVSLAGMLSPAARRRQLRRMRDDAARGADTGEQDRAAAARPPVATLLRVDEEYRRRGEAGELRRIAPRRFNPKGEAWLPVLDTELDGWRFTVLFSNTARAHQLATTHDWVVIYYRQLDAQGGAEAEGQATVVTRSGGVLDGLRAVRGREAECREYYAEHPEEGRAHQAAG